MLNDLKFGSRMLSKNLGFTAIAVIAMALGIGANTAVFSIVDAILWKPLAFPDQDRLVMLGEIDLRHPGEEWDSISPANFQDWREQTKTLDALSAFTVRAVNLAGEGEPERVDGGRVSQDLFGALGVAPAMGRTFRPEEDQEGRNHVVVLSHGLWQRRYGADPAILGQTILLEGIDHAVIGVMPKGFFFPTGVDLWIPLALTMREREHRDRDFLTAVARLRPGISLSQARAEMRTIAARLEQQYPQANKNKGVLLDPLRRMLYNDLTRSFSLMLLGAVGFVLLIACANVANLQYVNAGARQREIAVRFSIGASRWRVVQLMLTQSVLLGLLGAGFGLLIGLWGMDLLKNSMPPEVARFIAGWDKIALDGRVLGFTLGITMVSSLIAGIAPALQASRSDLNNELKEGGRSATSGRRRHRVRNILVVAEVSLAMVLMVGAGLLVKGFRGLAASAGQMAPESLLVARVSLVETKYKDSREFARFAADVLERIRPVPGVEAASLITSVPYGQHRSSNVFDIEGAEPPPSGLPRIAQTQSVSPEIFRVLRIPVRSGREFTSGDGADSPPVAIVSQELARRYFPGTDPVGRRVRVGTSTTWSQIVGVVGDLRHNTIERDTRPILYRPFAQVPTRHADYVIRTAAPASLFSPLRAQIRTIDSQQPVTTKSMDSVVAEERVGMAYVATMMAVMGAIALVLAAVGVYGVMAFSVSERTHEIGVRMALGALPRDVLAIVVGAGLRLACTGLAVGLALAWLLARALASLIFGVSATDAATFSGVSLFLILVALAACYVPARRAAGVDPMVALRHE